MRYGFEIYTEKSNSKDNSYNKMSILYFLTFDIEFWSKGFLKSNLENVGGDWYLQKTVTTEILANLLFMRQNLLKDFKTQIDHLILAKEPDIVRAKKNWESAE